MCIKNSHTNHFLRSFPILPCPRNFQACYHCYRPAAPLHQAAKQLTRFRHVQCSSERAGFCFGPSGLGQCSLCSALSFPLDFQGRSYSGESHFFHSSSTRGKCREPGARVSMWFSIYVQGSFFFVALPLAEWKSEVGLVFLALHLSRDGIIFHKI